MQQMVEVFTVGFFYNDQGPCTCMVWAPFAEKVELVIEQPVQAAFPLQRNDKGYWSGDVYGAQPGVKYRFRLNDEFLLPDPASLQQPDVHGFSILADRNYTGWTDHDWKGMALRDMIIYEIHTGTFTPQGNFNGIREKLPYLQQLGITAIEIMPVAQFPGSRNWGYDGVYPFAVQYSYGGIEELKKLVNEAHAHGIAVILDVVYNHLGPEGNYTSHYGPYHTDRYNTFWGHAMNFDDAWSFGVRDYFIQNALMWLDDFHIDGLRLDAVHAIADNSSLHFIEALQQRVRELEQHTGRKKVLIAEIDLNNPRYINPVQSGGYGFDGQWLDEFHHALHALLTGEVNGYYEDFGSIEHVERAYRDTYVYSGQYSQHRKRYFGVTTVNPYDQFVVFTQNHDQVGNRLLGDRISKLLSAESVKLMAAAVLLSPYIPMLFMGEEYGEENPFLFFISHTDNSLVEQVRKGRKAEFASFKHQEDFTDPQAVETFEQCVLSWNTSSEKNKALLECYRFLIRLRKEHPAMQYTGREGMEVRSTTNGLLILKRFHGPAVLLSVMNFSPVALQWEAEAFAGKKIYDSVAGATDLAVQPGDVLTLEHYGFIILDTNKAL